MSSSFQVAIRYMLLAGFASLAGVILLLVVECHKPNPLASKLALRAAEMFHQEFNDPGTLHFSDDWLDSNYHVVRTLNGIFEFQGWFQTDYVRDVRIKLGRFKSAVVKDCQTNHMAVGLFVTLTYSSQFDRGAATEKITFLINPNDIPDDAVMTSYIIESPLFPKQTNF